MHALHSSLENIYRLCTECGILLIFTTARSSLLDLALWLERLAVNADIVTALGSTPESYYTAESEVR